MMNWIVANIKWIMLLSGAVTCTMFYVVIAPQEALQSMFGTSLNGMLSELIVRNWGAMITLMGAILIYGAFSALSRALVLIISGISKLIFITLLLVYGQQYLSHQAGTAIALDLIMVSLFIGYLIGMAKQTRSTQQ
jgi:hypothetical protein